MRCPSPAVSAWSTIKEVRMTALAPIIRTPENQIKKPVNPTRCMRAMTAWPSPSTKPSKKPGT